MTPFSPSQISGLVMWQRSDQGAAVSQWNDLSGNGNHLVQATGAAQPVINASNSQYNGFPSVDFASGDYLQKTGLSYDAFTIFGVCRIVSGVGYVYTHADTGSFAPGDAIYSTTGTSLYLRRGATLSEKNVSVNWGISAVPKTYVHVNGGTHATHLGRVNGVELVTTDGNTGSPSGAAAVLFQLNGYAGNNETTTITYAELIVVNRAMTTVEIQQVEAYLQTRYAHY